MIAEYWDLLRGDTSGWSSRPYFLEMIRSSGEPALDVACGTGRLLIDYMQQGIDIDGGIIQSETYISSPALTWHLASEAHAMLEKAGFQEVKTERDFTHEPTTDEDTSFTVLGRKK